MAGLRSRATSFADRDDAGRQLAALVREADVGRSPVVFALPRGGVPVARPVATALRAPLDAFVARKLGAPSQPELGLGALAEGGEPVWDERLVKASRTSAEQLAALVVRERTELARRVTRYRGDRALPDVRGRGVVLVDDGLATGGTARAALRALRARGPGRLLLAIPVAAPASLQSLWSEADDVAAVLVRPDLHSIGQWYADFAQVTDEQVVAVLDDARHRAAADGIQ